MWENSNIMNYIFIVATYYFLMCLFTMQTGETLTSPLPQVVIPPNPTLRSTSKTSRASSGTSQGSKESVEGRIEFTLTYILCLFTRESRLLMLLK